MKAYLFLQRVSSFAGRAVVFFFITSMLTLFFYIIGNYQGFLDATQVFLLSILHVTLILEIVCGFYLAVFLVVRATKEHKYFVVRFVLLFLSLVFCTGLLLFLGVLQSWFRA